MGSAAQDGPKLAEEGGARAMSKIIKDGRNGRIVLLSEGGDQEIRSRDFFTASRETAAESASCWDPVLRGC